uniref:Uncharacterized protein n=1 Tax=Cannabis sativa TaxID=3483 RepID=A0A803NM15_CANSA
MDQQMEIMRAQHEAIINRSRQATVLIRRAYQLTRKQPVGNTLIMKDSNIRTDINIPNEPQNGPEEHLASNTQQIQGNRLSNPRSQSQIVGHTVDEQILQAHYLGGIAVKGDVRRRTFLATLAEAAQQWYFKLALGKLNSWNSFMA